MIGYAEGVSFLLLLGVAMPLKYLLDWPLAVKVLGWAHGVLFLLYLYAAVQLGSFRGWPLIRYPIAIAAALLPFGPFVFDRHLDRVDPAQSV